MANGTRTDKAIAAAKAAAESKQNKADLAKAQKDPQYKQFAAEFEKRDMLGSTNRAADFQSWKDHKAFKSYLAKVPLNADLTDTRSGFKQWSEMGKPSARKQAVSTALSKFKKNK